MTAHVDLDLSLAMGPGLERDHEPASGLPDDQDQDTDTDTPWASEAAYVGPEPRLDDLSGEARQRLVRFIVSSTLGGGVAPTAIMALYADLAGDDRAVRFADQRFMQHRVPADWREVEDHVVDLEEAARRVGVDLASAWQRIQGVAMEDEDPLEQIARLAGSPVSVQRPNRSIFDDPDDLDRLDDDVDEVRHERLLDRLPDLVDLEVPAQQRIRRYAIEETLEHGLAPVELLELYRTFELGGDERATQYLDRVFVDEPRVTPADWQDVRRQAQRVMELAGSRGRDAGRLYADVLRASPGLDPLAALQRVIERLQMGRS